METERTETPSMHSIMRVEISTSRQAKTMAAPTPPRPTPPASRVRSQREEAPARSAQIRRPPTSPSPRRPAAATTPSACPPRRQGIARILIERARRRRVTGKFAYAGRHQHDAHQRQAVDQPGSIACQRKDQRILMVGVQVAQCGDRLGQRLRRREHASPQTISMVRLDSFFGAAFPMEDRRPPRGTRPRLRTER